MLEKSSALAKQFDTDKVRCFDFWRLDDVAPYRAAIDDKLRSAAEPPAKGILLVLENEFECNTATGREAARTLNAIQSRTWPLTGTRVTPSCAASSTPSRRLGSAPEESNSSLPLQERREGMHTAKSNGPQWIKDSSTGRRIPRLKQIGYHDAVSLETHWHGAGRRKSPPVSVGPA